ncbi:DNA methyltransferase [Thiocystis violascens]|uniref:Methyltransferase n=1 Tax=Thiocystis violascens (strain ATCC 17096 / DSM 198 / 6111) TaxID=765911 RepID=I3YEH5_THIV6|nr:DNA methyltransferase [Thiocystis violascens]AFL75393.1 DNA modification methylase [Thiocystis violascens DSM 198]
MTFEKTEIGPCTLYRGDCLEVLAAGLLPKDAAIVSDPPYGIGWQKHAGDGKGCQIASPQGAKANTHFAPIAGDNAPFDPAPWLGFTKVVLFGANHFAQRLPEKGQWLCWDKSVGTGPADSFVDGEFAWSSVRATRNLFRHLWKGVLRDGQDAPSRQPKLHVSQKPTELMRWLIETARVRLGATVCDPYMGSGTTGIACIQTGRRFIGIEIDPSHYATACARIERAWADLGIRPNTTTTTTTTTTTSASCPTATPATPART